MDKSFGWAVIGSGAIADTVMREITKTSRHRVVSVYSRTQARAEKFARKYNAKVTRTFDEAVLSDGVEGVYIATPHSAHYREIMRCIELGVPVLSEKAFTINSEQTRAILNAKRQSYVSEAMWTRYNPITIKVREIIASKVLGEIMDVKATFCYDRRLSGFSDRVVRRDAGGGALLDIGVYPVSYMEMLFGAPESIDASIRLNKFGTDNRDDIILTYSNGLRCHIKVALDHFTTCGIKIKGTRGSISMPLFYRPIIARVKVDGKRQILRSKAGYIHEFDKVAKDIRAGALESSEIPISDSLSVMEILDEIRAKTNIRYDDDIESVDIGE